MVEILSQKLCDDYVKRVLKRLNNCEIIESGKCLLVINLQTNEWFFNLNLDRLYVGYNFWYFKMLNNLYGFNPKISDGLLLKIIKTKLGCYYGQTGEIIDSLVEWDVQPTFILSEYMDNLLKKNSNDRKNY